MKLKAPAACFKHEETFTGTIDGLLPWWLASALLEHSARASGILMNTSVERYGLSLWLSSYPVAVSYHGLRLWTTVGPAHKWMCEWEDTDSAVLLTHSKGHFQKLSRACHLRYLLQMFSSVGCMHSKPAAWLGYFEEIGSGLLYLVRKKWVPRGRLTEWHQWLIENCVLECPGSRAVRREENPCWECTAVVRGFITITTWEVRGLHYLLVPLNTLHACD